MEKSKTDIIAKLAADMVPIPGKRYSICKYPVTQELWEAVMGENPSKFKGSDRPVENVSWYDCRDFLQRLNAMPEVLDSRIFYRLPKVDELEFACLAGASGDYCRLSDGTEIAEETLGDVAWIRANSGGETHPVGQKKPNAFGLYDMLGNVMHWTDTPDVTSNYCYGCYWDDSHTAHYRCGYDSRTAGSFLGFRLAGTPVPKPEAFAGTDPRWGELLAAFPKFAVHEGWAELKGHDWSEILGKHPEFADKCDKWDDLYGHDWVEILWNSGAAFADKCDWTKLDSFDWMNLLSSRPEYAEHCDWSDLDYKMLSEDGDLAALLDDQPQLAAKCEWSRIPRSQKAEILLEHPEFMQYTGMHQLIIELSCTEFVELGRRIIPADDDADGPIAGGGISTRDRRRLYAVMKGVVVHGLCIRVALDGKVVFEERIDPENAKGVAFIDCGNLFDVAPPEKGRWLYGSECNDPTWLTPWQMIVPARFKFNPAKLTIPFYHARTSALSDVALLVPPAEIRYGKKRPDTTGENRNDTDFTLAPQSEDVPDKTTTQSFWLENEDGPEEYNGTWAKDDGNGGFFDEKFHFVTI